MTTQQKIEQKKAELQELINQLETERNDPKKFLKEILGTELVMKVDPEKYPNSVFYFKGENCLLEMEKSGDETYLWCNYYQIWNLISEKFSLDYASMQGLIRETVEEHFKMRDVTPHMMTDFRNLQVEEHFKMRDVTPCLSSLSNLISVEEHFKMRDVTPQQDYYNDPYRVEEHFKMRDVTPAIKK